MKISVFGLGYVGCVKAACLAKLGHDVIGIDIKKEKVDNLINGKIPIYERGLNEILNDVDVKKRLKFTTDIKNAVQLSDISFICVGTPSLPTGDIDSQYVIRVANDIGNELKNKNSYHLIVVTSTIFPGLIHSKIIPSIERASGKTVFVDFGIAIDPEFLREGSAIDDFLNTHKIIIGGDDEKSIQLLRKLYLDCQNFSEQIIYCMPIKQAQLVKYVDNIFHALKVVFANEIGSVAKSLDIDSQELMNIFIKDNKLNLSAYYFRPGFAYGGSCLPKDLRAFLSYSKKHELYLPLIENIEESNNSHIERAVQLIQSQLKRKIGFLGITFKTDTDDMRENPIFSVINKLIEKSYIPFWEKGYDIKLFDETLTKEDVKNLIPQYYNLFSDNEEEFLYNIDLIVVSNNLKQSNLLEKAIRRNIQIIDLQGIVKKTVPNPKLISLT